MENIANEVSPNIIITNDEKSDHEENNIILDQDQEIDENELIKAKNKSMKQQKVEKIIQKWLKLQKVIKEEITLEEVILKQQKDDFNYLKDLFYQYYEAKMGTRKQFEIIRKLEKNMKNQDIEYSVEKNTEKELLDTTETIKNLLFLIRNNPK